MPRKKDITGLRSGRLVAVCPTGETKDYNVLWYCKCDCGGGRVAKTGQITGCKVKSCGCLQGFAGPGVKYKKKEKINKAMPLPEMSVAEMLRRINKFNVKMGVRYDSPNKDYTNLVKANRTALMDDKVRGLIEAKLFSAGGL